MKSGKDKLLSVNFEPMGLKVEVQQGESVLDAAHKANIYLSSICGGDGYCGKCKVVVDKGHYQSRSSNLLTPDELAQDMVLACQTKILSDMIVTVPKRHGLEAGHILAASDVSECRQMKRQLKVAGFSIDPVVRKIFLKMSAPTVHDHTADHERLYLAIRDSLDAPIIQTGFRVLQTLSSVMKKASYEVTATVGQRGGTTEVVEVQAGDQSRLNYGVAIDLGTTTVVTHLIDMITGKVLDKEATYNSQINFGEDYIRRIIYAEEHNAFDELQDRIVQDVNDLLTTIAARQCIRLNDITACMVAGNTAMIHFLLNLDPTRIRREPYVASADFVPPIRAAEAGIQINKRGLMYCFPSVAAYVGGDIVAGVLATGLYESEGLCLLVDIGTNGEVVLGNRDWMMCASSSAGPAFEGSGVRHGMRAVKGAIEQLRISSTRRITVRTIGNGPPVGLCGSGLLDTLAELYYRGIIDRTGRFMDIPDKRLMEGEEGRQFQLVAPDGEHPEVVITQIDINNLIRSKAGVFAAIRVLMRATQISPNDLDAVYLAGGFGNFLNIQHAVRIGMLPDVSLEKIWFVGNTSIQGAKTALLSHQALQVSQKIAHSMTYVDLMSDSSYMEEFIRASFMPHTDLSLFPSIQVKQEETAKQEY